MQARIAEHKKARPTSWRTVEIPTGLGKEIEEQIGDAKVVIIGCLTLLRGEPDYPEAEKRVTSEIAELIAAMDKLSGSSSSPTRSAWGWCPITGSAASTATCWAKPTS